MMPALDPTRPALATICKLLALLCLAALPSGEALGAVVLTGAIEVIQPPPSLLDGQLVSQASIRLILEAPGVVTAGMPAFLYDGAVHDPMLPSIDGDVPFGNAITVPYAGPGLPAEGEPVYSVLAHYDPNLGNLPYDITQGMGQSATIGFDQDILGVYVTSGPLIATDSTFGPAGVSYSSEYFRDLEFNYTGDEYSISPDRRTLSLTMFAHNGGAFDELRIILASPPGAAVPDVVGETEAQAISDLEALGFEVVTTPQASASTPAGEVVGQSPASGSQAFDGSTVELVVSVGVPAELLEYGTVDVGGTPVTVPFAHAFISPVVVASVQYASNTTPVVTRVGNVTQTGFDVRLQNPSDGAVAIDRVHYLVVEEGTWTLDGFAFEAQTYESSVTDAADWFTGEPLSYGQPYTSPVVLGQVMTENDPAWSVFWARGDGPYDPPSPSTLIVGKLVGEDSDTTRANETVGVIVFEAGHGMLDGAEFEAGLGPESVEGVDDSPPYVYTFASPFAEAPQTAVVTMAGMEGTNGGWAQTHGATVTTTDSLYVSIDEDQILDAERFHIFEHVAYAVFYDPLPPPVPGVSPIGLAALGGLLAAVGMWRYARASAHSR